MKNIINNDKIAKFIGLTKSDVLYKNHFTYLGEDLEKAGLPFISGIMGNCMDNLPFNTFWDWLIPVIKKIHKTIGVKTIDECTVEEWNIYKLISDLSFYQEIENVYFACLEYINWYNKNSK